MWPDTFNNYFHPETSEAAVEVLEAAGYQVEVPEESLCCGRPLYDYGMLDMAERYLQKILVSLGPQLTEEIPIVVLEPSCLSVFRDEAASLLPDNEDARRLKKNSVLLSELLKNDKTSVPKLKARAVVHGHCHHKSLIKMNSEESVMSAMGLNYSVLDSGCCGMAGAFGFERDHYDVSIKAGERVLLPAVRKADKDALIIADGFSCREQIEQTTDRRALHLAQVIRMAIREGPSGPGTPYPEGDYQRKEKGMSAREAAILLGAGALLAGGMWMAIRGRRRSWI